MGKKRTVLVTGASGGIGGKTALKFASEGWDVICHYASSSGKMAGLEREVRALGAGFRAVKCDFGDRAALEGFLSEAKGLEIDALVSNAGSYMEPVHYSELGYDVLASSFSLNVFAPVMLMSALMGGMKERGFGRIVGVSSIAAKYGGSPVSLHYGCAKSAVEAAARTLARDGAEKNVLVNTVRPGVIDTDFHKKFPKDMTKRVAMIPMKRMGTAEEVAELLYFLGSEKNTYMTGETVAIAGGE